MAIDRTSSVPVPFLHQISMPTQQLAVRGILRDQGRIFTARRALTKRFYPGIYELPGGSVEFGEQFEEALRREFKEELQMGDKKKSAYTHRPDFRYASQIKSVIKPPLQAVLQVSLRARLLHRQEEIFL